MHLITHDVLRYVGGGGNSVHKKKQHSLQYDRLSLTAPRNYKQHLPIVSTHCAGAGSHLKFQKMKKRCITYRNTKKTNA